MQQTWHQEHAPSVRRQRAEHCARVRRETIARAQQTDPKAFNAWAKQHSGELAAATAKTVG